MDTRKGRFTASAPLQARAAPAPRRVAYHQGPPEIHFAGRVWRRGDAQIVTDDEWTAMQARADFANFDFKPTAQAPAADPKE